MTIYNEPLVASLGTKGCPRITTTHLRLSLSEAPRGGVRRVQAGGKTHPPTFGQTLHFRGGRVHTRCLCSPGSAASSELYRNWAFGKGAQVMSQRQ